VWKWRQEIHFQHKANYVSYGKNFLDIQNSPTEWKTLVEKCRNFEYKCFNPVKVKYAIHFTDFNETRSFLAAFRGVYL
jgi:hypothetical protein